MSEKRKYSLTVLPDDTEKFTTSNCNCDVCKSMAAAQVEWDSFETKTNLQKRMKKSIAKIERQIRKNNKNNKNTN